uniref:C40 family peptidase n=1 Tax=uncultured Olegusella sp. TaxID=1979846 RepID=UPI002627FDA2
RSLAFTLCAALLSANFTAPVYAVTHEELREQLKDAQAELAALQEKTENSAIALQETQELLGGIQSQIGDLEDKIDDTKSQLSESKKHLSKIMVANYKNPVTLTSILLNSASFEELTSNIHYADRVNAQQSQAINETQDLQNKLVKQKDSLEEKQDKLLKMQADQTKQQKEFQAAQDAQQNYVNSLSQEVQDALEKERKAEEERARKRAEEVAAAQVKREREAAEQHANEAPEQNDQRENNRESDASDSDATAKTPSIPTPIPPKNTSRSKPSSVKQAAVSAALSRLNCTYVYNASGPNQFDCSGLVWWAYKQAGVSIPRSQHAGMFWQVYNSGTWTTNVYSLSAGDLVFYGQPGATSHVALYIGDGQIVHANGTKVTVGNAVYGSYLGGGSIL